MHLYGKYGVAFVQHTRKENYYEVDATTKSIHVRVELHEDLSNKNRNENATKRGIASNNICEDERLRENSGTRERMPCYLLLIVWVSWCIIRSRYFLLNLITTANFAHYTTAGGHQAPKESHRRIRRWIHMVGTINFSLGMCSISTPKSKTVNAFVQGETETNGGVFGCRFCYILEALFAPSAWRMYDCTFMNPLGVKWSDDITCRTINHGGTIDNHPMSREEFTSEFTSRGERIYPLNHTEKNVKCGVHWSDYWHRHRQHTINFLTSFRKTWCSQSHHQCRTRVDLCGPLTSTFPSASSQNNRDKYSHGQIKVYTAAIHPWGKRLNEFRHSNYVCTKKLSRLLSTPSLVLLIVLLTVASASSHTIKYSTNVVKTKYGPLRGIVVRTNPPVELYAGVPYASPPVGSLRYMPPVTPSTWKNVKLADRFPPVCPQRVPMPPNGALALLDEPRERLAQLRRFHPLLANQSEDCLYLNLYVPKNVNSENGDHNRSLATIVYIHGESYEWNSGNLYDGSVLAAHGNIIVVTINFRLGVLGFLKTGTKDSAQGNFGLMDLVAGLHWLHENLPAFNGDAEKVTLMGHSTGAALANILVVSPVARDLAARAILLSGSALSPWAIQRDPLFVKRRVAEHTGCHGDLLEDDLAPCLRTKSLSDLLSVTLDSPRFLPGFAPFVDGTVIVNPTSSATNALILPTGSALASTTGLELADFPSRELLFGLTSIESYLDLSAQDLEFGFNESRRDRILRTYVRNIYHYHLNEIYSALKNEYTDWERPPRNPTGARDATLDILSDGHTAAPLVRLGYMHSLRGGRSYFLHFRHQSGERDFPQRTGSVRGEDVPFCLGLPLSPLFPYNYTKDDVRMSKLMVHYLTNFASFGNPNGPLSMTNAEDVSQEHVRSSKFKRKVRSYGDETSGSDMYEQEPRGAVRRDRLDEIGTVEAPFWDTYDAINQLYLELGSNVEVRNHYRGHKLSMWLSLIPQLHSGESTELSMRHHHFLEESAQYYDGIVRPQSLHRPATPAVKTEFIATTSSVATKSSVLKTTMSTVPSSNATSFHTTTDCPPNATVVPTIAATKPHQQQEMVIQGGEGGANNLLRRLANSQFHSYTTALTITIAVGCFLLLLNILIFAGIYYQREKRASDAKRKEELFDTEIPLSPSLKGHHSRKGSLQSLPPGFHFHHHHFHQQPRAGSFVELPFDGATSEKRSVKEYCDVELQDYQCSPANSSTSSTVRMPECKRSSPHDTTHVPQIFSTSQQTDCPHTSTSQQASAGHCNQGTQSDRPLSQDVGTTVTETDIQEDGSPGIPDPPPPPKHFHSMGILRQQGGSSQASGSNKKRVQIQEISV